MRSRTFVECVILGLAGAAAATRNYTQMEPVQLQASYWTDFLECMGNLSSLYDISVSEPGWVNVGPIENRDPDLNGTDARIWECVTAANNRLIASVGHNTANSEVTGPMPVDDVTHEWLVEGGARGQEPRLMSCDLSWEAVRCTD